MPPTLKCYLGLLHERVSKWQLARKLAGGSSAKAPEIWKSKILITQWDTGLVMFNVILGSVGGHSENWYNGITFVHVISIGVDLWFDPGLGC